MAAIQGKVGGGKYANAGAPVAGTDEVQTITISNFGACTLNLTFEGFSASVVLAGTENNTAIDTAVTSALEGLASIGTGGVTVSVSGTTDRAIAVTFAANRGKQAIGSVISATVSSVGGADAASGTLTSDATAPSDGDTVTIGARVYTFKTTLTPTAGEVLIGASAAAALDNLKSAINATAGAGTTYASGTSAHADVEATTNTDTTQLVVARVGGTAGNSIATTEASTRLSWGGATLAGGLAAESVASVETTPGVDATARGAGAGALLVDTTNKKLYVNEGTTTAPTWTVVGTQS